MKHLSTLALAVVSISSSVFCQPGIQPVPAKWLEDGRLVVAEFNFAINAPTPDAKWSYTSELPKVDGEGSTVFVADVSPGIKFIVAIFKAGGKLESPNGDQFIIGMKKTFPKDWQVQDSRYEVSDVPLKDSRKFKVKLGLPNGSTYYSYGYLVSGSRSYQIITFSTSSTEPVALTPFAKSFTLL